MLTQSLRKAYTKVKPTQILHKAFAKLTQRILTKLMQSLHKEYTHSLHKAYTKRTPNLQKLTACTFSPRRGAASVELFVAPAAPARVPQSTHRPPRRWQRLALARGHEPQRRGRSQASAPATKVFFQAPGQEEVNKNHDSTKPCFICFLDFLPAGGLPKNTFLNVEGFREGGSDRPAFK